MRVRFECLQDFSDSFMKLSEKGYEQRSKRGCGRHGKAKTAEEFSFGDLQGHAVGTSGTFQTVS